MNSIRDHLWRVCQWSVYDLYRLESQVGHARGSTGCRRIAREGVGTQNAELGSLHTQSDSESQSFGGRGRIVASANRATVAYLPRVASAKVEARGAMHEEEALV